MQDIFNILDVDYYVLNTAFDANTNNFSEVIVFTNSRDVFDDRGGFIGMNNIFACSERFLYNNFIDAKCFVFAPECSSDMKSGLYKHYKNKLYSVIGLGYNLESSNECVIYKNKYADERFDFDTWFVRDKKNFLETVSDKNYTGPRFKYIR